MSDGITLPRASAKGRPQNHRWCIGGFGMTGSGKTSFFEEILLANKERLLICDTQQSDYGNPDFCQANGISYDAVTSRVEDLSKFLSKPKFRVVLRHSDPMKALRPFMYDQEKGRGLITDATVAIEEIGSFMDATSMAPELANLVVLGRHSRINLLGIAQRPRTQTNPTWRGMLNAIVAFRQVEKVNIDYFAEIDAEKAARLRDLAVGEYELFLTTPLEFVQFINAK